MGLVSSLAMRKRVKHYRAISLSRFRTIRMGPNLPPSTYLKSRYPMKILITRKIKRLFCRVLLSFILFTLISVACTLLQLKHAALYVLLSFA